MGYRSEVCLILTAEGERQLRDKIASLSEDDDTRAKVVALLHNHPDITWIDQSTGDVLYHWDSLKWYDEYSEMAFMNLLFKDIDANNYLFLRIGEYYTNIETKGNYWDNSYAANIYRSIGYQLPNELPQEDTTCATSQRCV